MASETTRLTFDCDELDASAINEAIALWQRNKSGTADSGSSKGGAILAEICRSWQEYRAMWQPPNQGEEWKE